MLDSFPAFADDFGLEAQPVIMVAASKAVNEIINNFFNWVKK